jgi:hypothetical protein
MLAQTKNLNKNPLICNMLTLGKDDRERRIRTLVWHLFDADELPANSALKAGGAYWIGAQFADGIIFR